MTANFLVKNSSSSKDHASLLSVSIREERNEYPQSPERGERYASNSCQRDHLPLLNDLPEKLTHRACL